MNSKYLEACMQQNQNPELLVNLISRRVRQLAQGHRPLIQPEPRMDFADIALKEFSEGKISYELPTAEESEPKR